MVDLFWRFRRENHFRGSEFCAEFGDRDLYLYGECGTDRDLLPREKGAGICTWTASAGLSKNAEERKEK